VTTLTIDMPETAFSALRQGGTGAVRGQSIFWLSSRLAGGKKGRETVYRHPALLEAITA
jgi:hypothetical protein